MEYGRKPRKVKEIMKLGDTLYHLSDVEGIGGSAIVYRASYEDKLNKGNYHQVFIKELFPYHPKGYIYRDENGNIVCEQDGEELLLQCKESFYQGNQANLNLLLKEPEYISGNINSYEAYGTFYSVLTLHGGENLQKLLDAGKFCTLSEAADIILKILDALECFHKNEILHLDISPDNVMILSKQAMLIDYNSVWPFVRKKNEIYYYSEKEGYSAPEIKLRNEKHIGIATDLYSVCAVFFRMLTGRCLTGEDLLGKSMAKCFPRTLESMKGQSVTAWQKAVQIICKGLHLLARKRYQSIEEMRADMKELLLRIEGKGISDSAIWEASKKNYRKQKQIDGQYLERWTQNYEGEKFSEEECLKILRDGKSILLKGPGGMGKTSFLMKLWEMGVRDFRKDISIVVYISLGDYQQTGGESYYIRKSILKNLVFSSETENMEDAMHELEHIFTKAEDHGKRYVLLLDGLNEAGTQRENLLKEIEGLSHFSGIGILVTDRTDSVKKYGLAGFESMELLPLMKETVEQELQRCNVRYPLEENLKHMLCNPMMLHLYCKAFLMSGTMSERNTDEADIQLETVEDMVSFYMQILEKQEQRKYSGDEKEQLRIHYLLNHFLPKFANELKKNRKSLFSLEELYSLVKKDYQILQGKYFGLAFPEYMGKTRSIYHNIKSDREWFDYMINEQLIGKLNLVEMTGEGNYGLIHDNFMDCLAVKAKENSTILRRCQKKIFSKRIAAGTAAVLVLIAGSVLAVRQMNPKRGWDKILEEPVNRLVINLSVWDSEMKSQMEILERAESDAVLNGSHIDIINLQEQIQMYERNSSVSGIRLKDGSEYLSLLDEKGMKEISDLMEDFYQEPYDLNVISEEILPYFSYAICDSDTIYRDIDSRKALVVSYQQYLEAVTTLNFWKYNLLLNEVDEETTAYLRECAREMVSFRELIMEQSLGAVSKEKIETAISVSEDKIVEAVKEMTLAGYDTEQVKAAEGIR